MKELKEVNMSQEEKTIEELEEHIKKLKAFVEHHLLTASKYLMDAYQIEDIVKKRREQNEKNE